MKYKVYAKYEEGVLVGIRSSAFPGDFTGWDLIGEGEGDRYAHAQHHWLDGPLAEPDGTCRYKRGKEGKPGKRTAKEMAADRAQREKDKTTTMVEKLEALEARAEMIAECIAEMAGEVYG